jgi:hypothetical protein
MNLLKLLHQRPNNGFQPGSLRSRLKPSDSAPKKMKTIGGKINIDYGWEITVFHKIRNISDGIIFFEKKINWDRYLADHSPRFEIHVILFNYTIIEINIYYLHLRDNE